MKTTRFVTNAGKDFPTRPVAGKKYRRRLSRLGGLLLSLMLFGGLGIDGAHAADVDTTTSAARLLFAEEAVVRGAPIRLGDLARVQTEDETLRARLENLVVRPLAPPLGRPFDIRTESVRILLRRAERTLGVDDAAIAIDGAPVTRVRLESAEIAPDAVLEAIRPALEAYARETYGAERIELEFATEVGPIAVPVGAWEAAPVLTRLPRRPMSRWLVPVEIRVDERLFRTTSLALKLHSFARVGIATRAIRRHEELREGDVEYVEMELTALNGNAPIPPLADALGIRATRAIRKGEPLTEENCETLPLIFKGDLVTVILEAPLMRLTMVGQAQEDGRYGDVIRIQNLRSGKVIRGVVVQPQLAKVTLPTVRPQPVRQTAQTR